MHQAIMFSLTIMVEDHNMVLKATEVLARAQAGLALEGLHTSLSVSTVEYEESEQDQT